MRYDYNCKECSATFEKSCSIADRDKQSCPKCNSENIVRLLSSPNAIFIGDDFTKSVKAGE